MCVYAHKQNQAYINQEIKTDLTCSGVVRVAKNEIKNSQQKRTTQPGKLTRFMLSFSFKTFEGRLP